MSTTTITLVTQNGAPIVRAEREARQAQWLSACEAIEAELGPCTSATVDAYRERLAALEASLPAVSATLQVAWPATPQAMKELLEHTGSVIALEVHEGKVSGVCHVA